MDSHTLLVTSFTTGITTVFPNKSNAFLIPLESLLNIDKV